MDNKIKLLGFQKEYKMLTTKFKKEHPELFNLGIVVAHTSEVKEGFIVKKQLRTTSNGTKFSYEALKSREELAQYTEKVIGIIKTLNVEEEIKKMQETLKKSNEEGK